MWVLDMSVQVLSYPVNWDCVICQEPLATSKSVMSKRCLHIFHESCLNQSLNRKLECPLCKLTNLNESELVECTKIKELYQKCFIEKTSTLESELISSLPKAVKTPKGYLVQGEKIKLTILIVMTRANSLRLTPILTYFLSKLFILVNLNTTIFIFFFNCINLFLYLVIRLVIHVHCNGWVLICLLLFLVLNHVLVDYFKQLFLA